jgi:hypothetical protein
MLTRATKEAILTVATAVGGVLHGCKVALATSGPVPVDTNVFADFTAANFTGYAQSAAQVFSTPFINTDGDAETLGTLALFQPSDAVAPNTITHVLLVDSTGAVLVGGKQLPAPVPLPDAASALALVPKAFCGDDGMEIDFVQVS